MQLEVCASTPVDVAMALEAGADRVELCAHWECGGLTPSSASIRASASLDIPVRVLVRPRAGHFVYNASERSLILSESMDCMEAGADKVVVGGLTEEGELDYALMEMLVDAVGAEKIVMHRALDLSSDPMGAADALIDMGVREVLTSGGASAAGLGLDLIRELSGAGMEVIAGGGVRAEDVVALGESGVSVVHASCRVQEKLELSVVDSDKMKLFDLQTSPVDYRKVESLVNAVYNWNASSEDIDEE